MHDVIIIGAGPAGLTAAVYASRHKLNTLVLAKAKAPKHAEKFSVAGFSYSALVHQFDQLLKTSGAGLEFKDKQEIISIEKNVVSFSVENKRGEIFYAKNVIMAYGAGNELGFENLTAKTADGKIKIDSRQATNVPGIWAIGDAAVGAKKDVFTSAGEGARAVLSIISGSKKSP